MKSYHFLFVLLLACACSPTKRLERAFGESLFQHWVHAHEEDQAGYRAFRPADHELPPSRGREGFEIRRDGRFIHYPIGAADAANAEEATWKLKDKSILVITPADPGRLPFELHLLEMEQELLKIAQYHHY